VSDVEQPLQHALSVDRVTQVVPNIVPNIAESGWEPLKNQLTLNKMSRAFFLVTLVIAMILSLQTNAVSMKKILLKSTAAMSSLGLLVNSAYADMNVAPFDDKIRYEVVTAGKGDMPKIGDLVSIRFKASYKGKDFDNTFETPQPYMFRAG
jgi:hypothetical protein